VRRRRVHRRDADRDILLGDSIATNLFMLGVAYQKGLVPISGTAIGPRHPSSTAPRIAFNREAIPVGRLAAHRRAGSSASGDAPADRGRDACRPPSTRPCRPRCRADALSERRLCRALRDAGRAVESAERAKGQGPGRPRRRCRPLALQADGLQGRVRGRALYTTASSSSSCRPSFEGDFRLEFHLARRFVAEGANQRTGHLRKRAYGAWMMGAFAVLARLKGLRGTKLDLFAYSESAASSAA